MSWVAECLFFPEVSKCLGDIMSGWQNVSATQCPGGKMSCLLNVRVSKCLSVKMSKCQNVEVSKVDCLQNVRCQNVGEPLPPILDLTPSPHPEAAADGRRQEEDSDVDSDVVSNIEEEEKLCDIRKKSSDIKEQKEAVLSILEALKEEFKKGRIC